MEYTKRIEYLKTYLEKENIDMALIISPKSVFYYTGFDSNPHERFMALAIDLINKKEYLFVPSLDKEAAKQQSSVQEIISVSDGMNPYEKLKDTVGSQISRVGLETQTASIYQLEQLNRCFPGFQYKNIGAVISDQRMRKSKEESKKVKRAVEVIEQVLREGIENFKIGMTEMELTAEFEYLMKKFGAEGPSFSTTVLSGEKSALPHGSPGNRKIIHGDFLLIDMGVVLDGYCSDITRTFMIGEENQKQKEIYETVQEAVKQAVGTAKARIPLGDVDSAARRVISEAGFGKYFNHRVGHGLGIEAHEEPSIHENNQGLIESGLLFTIEPGIYISNLGGVRIEENVYIDENGEAEVLTTFPTELIRLG
ncbi:aminopeptidase P family protein [Siminovitchia sp. 179-K 8D1 HS]|uniref:aminopeptidase P family protein n=1 Tax=Siminovitchia sp. 179-K 8D1 HS TaxID=3142385 RepID=UPI0039A05847